MSEISLNLVNNPLTPNSSPYSSESQFSPRIDLYKNCDKSLKQLRRRRSETVVELRKQKKDSDSDRRRNISIFEFWSDNEDFDEEEDKDIDLNALQIIDLLKTTDIFSIPAKYVRHLRKQIPKETQLKSDHNLMEQLMSEDIMTKLLNCITNEKCLMSLLYEVVALITHLCSGDKEQILVLVKYGIVGNLLSLLSYDNFGVIEQSILGLTYIWNSCPEMSERLNSSQFLNILIRLIDSETSVTPSKMVSNDSRIGLVRALSWTLFIICQNHDQTTYRLSAQFIPYFVKLLKFSDSEVKTNVLKTLSITTERIPTIPEYENSPILKMVQSVVSNDSLFSSIIDSLSAFEEEVVLNAIRIIGNIVSWGESFTQIVIQAKALQNFGLILTHSNPNIQKEGAFTVSNITAGNLAQIQSIIDANLIPNIVELLYMGEYKTQVEASHVMLNISAVGSFAQIYYILNIDNSVTNMDIIDAMVTLMTSTDASVINTCLQFYNNILVFAKSAKVMNTVLKRCDSSALSYHLDSLQSHSNSQIALLATHITDEFFSRDSSFEEDINLNTSLDEKQMETNISF